MSEMKDRRNKMILMIIGSTARYSPDDAKINSVTLMGTLQHIADIGGAWKAIIDMCNNISKKYENADEAANRMAHMIHNDLGEFVAEALNEKMERERAKVLKSDKDTPAEGIALERIGEDEDEEQFDQDGEYGFGDQEIEEFYEGWIGRIAQVLTLNELHIIDKYTKDVNDVYAGLFKSGADPIVSATELLRKAKEIGIVDKLTEYGFNNEDGGYVRESYRFTESKDLWCVVEKSEETPLYLPGLDPYNIAPVLMALGIRPMEDNKKPNEQPDHESM